jgi:hypothetical protein
MYIGHKHSQFFADGVVNESLYIKVVHAGRTGHRLQFALIFTNQRITFIDNRLAYALAMCVRVIGVVRAMKYLHR